MGYDASFGAFIIVVAVVAALNLLVSIATTAFLGIAPRKTFTE